MREFPLRMIVDGLDPEVIDEFLNVMRATDGALWSTSSGEAEGGRALVTEAFSNLISSFETSQGVRVLSPKDIEAGSFVCGEISGASTLGTVCVCTRHPVRGRSANRADHHFRSDPETRLSQRIPR